MLKVFIDLKSSDSYFMPDISRFLCSYKQLLWLRFLSCSQDWVWTRANIQFLFCSLESTEHDKGPLSVPVNQIAGQPISSTEQEVIGLLLAQQQVYTNPENAEAADALSQHSSDSGTVAVVPPEVLQDDTEEKEAVSVSCKFQKPDASLTQVNFESKARVKHRS